MCGLCGFIEPGASSSQASLQDAVFRMNQTLHHRGPDDEGYWIDEQAGVALAHKRLSILDLSPAGRQPMVSASGRCLLVFNGEVFNFAVIRAELEQEGFRFQGHSDSEVVLAACEHWGVEAAVSRFIGMFALALWEREGERLTLVRDRLGIKPLYWAIQNNRLLFASQPKAITAHPRWQGGIDRDALALFLRFSNIPAPHSIHRGIQQVRPGHLIRLTRRAGVWQEEQVCYWDVAAIASHGQDHPVSWSDDEAVARLDALLRDAVQLRMVSDVPLGAFLSGGVDSSTVVALMQAQSHQPIRTFSIGFHEERFNEAQHAAQVAKHLGTDHTELYVTPAEAREVIPRLPEFYDEPFADSSQIPTLLVCQLTRKKVTVALSGDGGDENFSGYNRYLMAGTIERIFSRLPVLLRQGGAGLLSLPPPSWWDLLGRAVPASRRPRLLGDKLHKLAAIMALPQVHQVYPRLVSFWHQGESLVPGAAPPLLPLLDDENRLASFPSGTGRMQLLDFLTYLPNDILTKVDRASMAVGLEARVPLLDHRVVELAWQLPPAMKIRGGQGKWLLRQVLYRYVPQALIERPKMGFGVPIDEWLRGPLREWAEDLLAENFLKEDDLFLAKPIRDRWQEHLSGRRNWQYHLWNVLMAQSFRRRWLSS